MTIIQGVIHGNRIDLELAPGLPDGQPVTVEIRPTIPSKPADREPPPPTWLERFELNPSVKVGKYVVKGTRLLVDDLVELVGQGDAALRASHPELSTEDVDAIRHYARLPLELRRSFGSAAEEAEELDRFVEDVYRLRNLPRRGIDE